MGVLFGILQKTISNKLAVRVRSHEMRLCRFGKKSEKKTSSQTHWKQGEFSVLFC